MSLQNNRKSRCLLTLSFSDNYTINGTLEVKVVFVVYIHAWGYELKCSPSHTMTFVFEDGKITSATGVITSATKTGRFSTAINGSGTNNYDFGIQSATYKFTPAE